MRGLKYSIKLDTNKITASFKIEYKEIFNLPTSLDYLIEEKEKISWALDVWMARDRRANKGICTGFDKANSALNSYWLLFVPSTNLPTGYHINIPRHKKIMSRHKVCLFSPSGFISIADWPWLVTWHLILTRRNSFNWDKKQIVSRPDILKKVKRSPREIKEPKRKNIFTCLRFAKDLWHGILQMFALWRQVNKATK